MHCMYWYGILEGTRALRYNYLDGKGDTAPENFGIHFFVEHDRFDILVLSTNKGWYVHAMCKMLLFRAKTGKHLHSFFVLT